MSSDKRLNFKDLVSVKWTLEQPSECAKTGVDGT